MIGRVMAAVVDALTEFNTEKALGFKTIKEHAGAFTWAEFQERGFNAPAAFVSSLGWREKKQSEEGLVYEIDDIYVARFGVAVITQNAKNAEARNKQGRLMCEYLSAYLQGNNFGFDEVSQPYNIKCDPRFMGVINEDGQALWILDWFCQLPMCPDEMPPLDDFDGVDIDHQEPNEEQILAQTTVDLTEE